MKTNVLILLLLLTNIDLSAVTITDATSTTHEPETVQVQNRTNSKEELGRRGEHWSEGAVTGQEETFENED